MLDPIAEAELCMVSRECEDANSRLENFHRSCNLYFCILMGSIPSFKLVRDCKFDNNKKELFWYVLRSNNGQTVFERTCGFSWHTRQCIKMKRAECKRPIRWDWDVFLQACLNCWHLKTFIMFTSKFELHVYGQA